MFWSIIYRKKLRERDNSARRSRIRGTGEKGKNLLETSLGIGCRSGGESRKRKVQPLSTGSSEDRAKKIRKGGGNDGVCDINEDVDKISELPEPIIHLIFAFLRSTKDVVRTSVLSKKWKSVFDSYLTFDFDEMYFRKKGMKRKHNRIKAREIQKKNFKNYVDNSLASRLQQLPCIHKFRLRVTYMDSSRMLHMDKWINAALSKKVKELEVHGIKENPYFLPDDVLCSTSITRLQLSSCFLLMGRTRILHNLKILSFKEMMASYGMIKILVENCPMIEDLRLVYCSGPLYVLRLALAKLKRLEVHQCQDVTYIEIEAPNLETFWYHAKRDEECEFDLKSCGNLKNLTLKAPKMTDRTFQECLSKCPLLEKLVLQECIKLDRLTILSEKLKCLSLINCGKFHEANIDAPNLYSFHCSGPGLTLPSLNVSGLSEAKFLFGPYTKTSQLFVRKEKFFKNIMESNHLMLITYSKKDMKIFAEPRQAVRVDNSFDKLELCASLTAAQKILDTWLSACGANCLSLLSPSDKLLKAINKMIGRGGDPKCCNLYSYKKKCWRHYLKGVEITNSHNEHRTSYVFKWKKILTEE